MSKAVPWAIVGVVMGAAVGFAWGRTARDSIGDAVSTSVDGGRVSVTFDLGQAAASGLPGILKNWAEG